MTSSLVTSGTPYEIFEYMVSLNVTNIYGETGQNHFETISIGSSLAGDVNGDGEVSVSDLVIVVNLILLNEYNAQGDLNEDGALNVVDLVMIVDFILDVNARGEEATYAELKIVDNIAYIIADGIVSGIQMTLSHTVDFQINMTDKALVADYKTRENETILVVAAPESNEIFSFEGNFEVTELIVASTLGEIESRLIPVEFTLTSAYPNPFNPVTTIQYGLPVDAAVNIIVYDLQGRKTAELVNELKTAGYYTLKWDASDHASGIYFVKLMTSEFTKTQKLVLVK